MKAIEKLIGKKVIIRADRAGVFYGTLNEVEPQAVVLGWCGKHHAACG